MSLLYIAQYRMVRNDIITPENFLLQTYCTSAERIYSYTRRASKYDEWIEIWEKNRRNILNTTALQYLEKDNVSPVDTGHNFCLR